VGATWTLWAEMGVKVDIGGCVGLAVASVWAQATSNNALKVTRKAKTALIGRIIGVDNEGQLLTFSPFDFDPTLLDSSKCQKQQLEPDLGEQGNFLSRYRSAHQDVCANLTGD